MQLRSSTGKVIPLSAHTQLGRSVDPRLPAVVSRELATLTVSSDQQCELKATKAIAVIPKDQPRSDHRRVLRLARCHCTWPWTCCSPGIPTSKCDVRSSSITLQPQDRAHVFDGDFIVMRWDESGLHGFELQAGPHAATAVGACCTSGCALAKRSEHQKSQKLLRRLPVIPWSRHRSGSAPKLLEPPARGLGPLGCLKAPGW